MHKKLTKEFGKHYLVEFIKCNSDKLKYVKDVQEPLSEAARLSEAHIFSHHFHQFEPVGVTGIILIGWSHFSVHTWPEDQYVTFDILTCGKMSPDKAIDYLQDYFEAKQIELKVIPRGF